MDPVLLELFLLPCSPDSRRAKKITAKALKLLDTAVLVERDVSEISNKRLAARYGIKDIPALLINRRYKSGIPESEDELLWVLRRVGVVVRAES